jgi:hypothetical protein
MRKMVPLALAGMAAVLLSGCAHRRMGAPGGPDEFAVARAAPLVIPPDFSLKPPQPGAAPTQGQNPQEDALQAMFGGPAQHSASESSVLQGAGADDASDGIRSDAGDPDTNVVDKGQTTRDIEAAPAGDGQDATTSVPQ